MSNKATKKKFVYPLKKWTQEEIDFLNRVYEDLEYSIEEIAKAIERTPTAVVKRAKSLGLSRNNPYVNRVTKEGHRICATCKQELPFESFVKCHRKRYGVESSCKACTKLKKLQKEEEKAKQKALNSSNKKTCTVCNQTFDLTEEFFSWIPSKNNFNSACKKCNAERVKLASEESYRKKGYKK